MRDLQAKNFLTLLNHGIIARKKRAPCGALFWIPVQIVFDSGHTSGSYVKQEGWKSASIVRCPACKRRIPRHGTYARKTPEGTRVARFYCRPCKMTVSLLPDFLAAGYCETLAVQRAALEAVKAHLTFDDAARATRPEIELQGARRWLRRRLRRHALTTLIVATVLAMSLEDADPFAARLEHPEVLRHAPTPTGLAHRPLRAWGASGPNQQPTGPDPPSEYS